jgi:limonene-1,2-epoxide hydrolase
MTQEIGDQFINALDVVEKIGDLEPMRKLFSESCTVWNVQMKAPLKGLEGVQKFWTQYKGTFQDIHSHFTHREDSDHCVVLEWHSKGHAHSKHDIEYDGATILEHDGEKIVAFRSYFDTHAVTHPVQAKI